MNTQKLQKNHPKVYQDFFSKCQKVVSAPHSFFWSGDFSGFYGGLTILQKIPLRFYVGLQNIAPRGFEIDRNIACYQPWLKKFKEVRIDDDLHSKLNVALEENFKGYKIHFFSEVALGSSLGSLGAMSACLSQLLANSEQQTEKEIFRSAWQIAKQLQQGRTSGATAYTALSESSYPVVFYSKNTKYWAKSLDQLFPLADFPAWPIDFGLIFSGNLVHGQAVIKNADEVKKDLEKRKKEVQKLIGSVFSNSFWENYLTMLNQVTGQNLIALSEIFKRGADDRTIGFLFDTLNQYQNLLYFLGISTPSIDKIYSAVHKISNKLENGIGSGCKITGVGKGGEVLFAFPFGQCRENVKKLIENCKLKIENCGLDYTSWEDGFEKNGIKVEQDLGKKQISPFIKSDSYLLKIYQKENCATLIIGEKEIDKNKKSLELFLDTSINKIYIKGRGLTSKKILSQKASVEILKNLLESQEKILKNLELPKSYSQSRYDLQSKITSPLSKISKLRFEIKGGMYEDYSLKLQPFSIKIGILEKLV